MDTVVLPDNGALKEIELEPKFDLLSGIKQLRREKNAVILAHYYQDAEIQDLADFVGDSLDLSKQAAATDAEMIVFSGVRFMAEVAKILNPDKIVVLPDAKAGCTLEDECRPKDFARFRAEHPDHIAITYINCSAEVKALSDIIVTSSNAEHIINQLPTNKPILFAPDRHLGSYLAGKTGRNMTLWDGTCIVHDQFSVQELANLKAANPDALVTAHPECSSGLLDQADHVGSTRGILDFVLNSPASKFIVATERHIIHQMKKAAPEKIFIAAPGADGSCGCSICPYMELNTIEKIYLAMKNEAPRIEIQEELRLQALKPLKKMLRMSLSAGGITQAAE